MVIQTNPYYGWIVVGVSTLVLMGFYGTELSFGVFLKPIIEELGWTRASAAGAMSIVMGVSGPVGIVTGKIADHYGSRMVIATGAMFSVVGYILLSQADSLWQLYLYFGFFMGVSISACWAPLISTVSRWITEKRVLAIGILTSGLTLGSMTIPPIIAYYMTFYGWRHAFWILAFIVVAVTLPAMFVLGKSPRADGRATKTTGDKKQDAGQVMGWPAKEAVKTLPFLLLITIGFVTSSGFFFLATHIVAHATDLGIGITAAALILSHQSIGNIPGKILAWPLTRKVGSRFALVFLVGLQACTMVFFIWADHLWMFFALAVAYGFGLGGSMAIRMSMIPELYGTRAVGTLVGIAGVAWGLGGIVGPIFAGYIFDTTRSYAAAFLTGGLLLVVGVVTAFFLKTPKMRSKSLSNHRE